jgi:hypothetical protein
LKALTSNSSNRGVAREPRWALRDWVAASALFAATAGAVWWQNAHVAVLWDLGYVLDSAARIAAGQMPYRDFPFAHAPLTFLIQAAIIRLTGRVFTHQILYTVVIGGLGTVLAWRVALETLRGRASAAWPLALLLAAPLSVLGIYCILPNPEYDCDCALAILAALWLLQRVGARKNSVALGFAAGFFACVPLFLKQNMGLLFLVAVVGAVAVVLGAQLFRRSEASTESAESSALLAVLAGAFSSFLAATLLLHWTVGIENYIRWTVGFAAQRRMPGFADMLGVYHDPSLLLTLPCVLVALALLRFGVGKRVWAQIAAFALLAAPFLFTLASLLIYDDADERGDSLLALWPLLLLLAAALALANLFRFRHQLRLRALLPLVMLLAINGTFMSQQLWGSTYAIWPLLILLLAEMVVYLDGLACAASARWFAPSLAALISAALLVCGGSYIASEERLSYAQLPDGPTVHSAFPQLAGMSTPGPYLAEFDELLRYAQANIPIDDGLILLPGEEPFYFASGRVPQFPITLFDPSTDPYSPYEIASLVRTRNIRWLIVKRDLQLKEDPTPERAEVMDGLMHEFTLAAHLRGYDVYRR